MSEEFWEIGDVGILRLEGNRFGINGECGRIVSLNTFAIELLHNVGPYKRGELFKIEPGELIEKVEEQPSDVLTPEEREALDDARTEAASDDYYASPIVSVLVEIIDRLAPPPVPHWLHPHRPDGKIPEKGRGYKIKSPTELNGITVHVLDVNESAGVVEAQVSPDSPIFPNRKLSLIFDHLEIP